MTTETVVAPIIHLNGTSAERLVEALSNTYSALFDAYDKLRQCAPNGRDYYQEPGRMQLAEAQHTRRQHLIWNLMDELEREMELIQEQKN